MTLNPVTINRTEVEERAYLEDVKEVLRDALHQIDARVRRYAQEVQEQKAYSWEHRADMDHVEKIATRQSIEQAVATGEAATAAKRRINKLISSPYFGRVDFIGVGHGSPMLPVYIGVHAHYDDVLGRSVVFDWRAPISSLFYDFETGPARYPSPAGDVSGEIALKRQYRIRDGRLEFMLESGLNIIDDVLQEELSRASDDGMKTIVATIQRDQNAIIRNEHADVLIIQGVAGSGKTSIALHRIAFLLYRFKDSLTSSDILIISPNRVFADYISNVLPELGEEAIEQIGMETLADELLDHKFRFQTFFEQTATLAEKDDEEMRRRISFKSSPEFVRRIDDYAEHVERQCFVAKDLQVRRRPIPAWSIQEAFDKNRGIGATERIARVVDAIEHKIGIYYHFDLTTAERATLRTTVRQMYRQSSLRETYKNLFEWVGQPDLLRSAAKGRLEYADVFPLIYLKMRLEGLRTERGTIKHLLIDEMQDYTPVHYAVIAGVFRCKKTILGDANQAVNPYSASRAEDIQRVLRQATCVKLSKSYRSSFEIMQFAKGILPDPDLVAIRRHGEAPQVLMCRNKEEELGKIGETIDGLSGAGHNSLGIICKTQKQADRIFAALRDAGHKPHLLGAGSDSFRRGVVVCTAHMAKGLEFDQVVVPETSDGNYDTAMDRNLLYVACTRAMHKLVLTFTGQPSRFVPPTSIAAAEGRGARPIQQ
ncbi:MAG: ATP-binding domain-containing protein [Rhodospirillales bacterium]|nr:ATP-binding domain-containing protein [Rhodospirillales bacterium]